MKKQEELNKNTEQKIIDVATELFAKKGFEGASTREICKQAGANISLISYYFGGKKELYEKVVATIVGKIFLYMKSKMGFQDLPKTFDGMTQKEKTDLLFRILDTMIDYFYSDNFNDSAAMIIFREQITSGIPLNAEGYKVLKRLLASILEKDENDKEIIFTTITIVGKVHSARVYKQFTLDMMDQSGYSKEDIQMLKQIIIGQTKAVLKSLGALDEG